MRLAPRRPGLRRLLTVLLVGLALAPLARVQAADPGTAQPIDREILGRLLFFDPNLSKNRTQSCATCHDPARAFTDPRGEGAARAVSLGDDGRSLGDRNAPTAAYARFSPAFHRDAEGRYFGGQFLDGRTSDLAAQAAGPPPTPPKMGMPDQGAVVARLRENPVYQVAFPGLFGADIWEDPPRAYEAMTRAIAAFEETELFAPFDSKYDRHLRGEYEMTPEESLGMTLFFSGQFTNCHLCHQGKGMPATEGETFSNYQYHNIGVPPNDAVRALNGKAPGHRDLGLGENPGVEDRTLAAGRFKTPTLRNVAVTGPYMHNGVLKDLRTTILFYNKYNSRSPRRQINPETGEPWLAPEVPENLSLKELEMGPALDDRRIDALVAFLKTLTDRRYEHLLGEGE